MQDDVDKSEETRMYQPVKIAPSILSADFMDLRHDIDLIERLAPAWCMSM